MTAVAIFRCEASVEIGAGHVVRCLALARELVAAGWACHFATSASSLAVSQELSKFPILLLSAAEADDPLAMRRYLEGCDLLVIDDYRIDARYESVLRGWASRILVIDDLADRPHDCDLLIDQTYGRRGADYGGSVPPGCRLLIGTTYALLRPEFRLLRAQALAKRAGITRVKRILVSLGATDPAGATMLALDAITRAAPCASVDVVLGQSAPYLRQVLARIENLDQPVCVHVEVQDQDMAQLMLNADLAIGACGGTAWERCCLGLPSIVVMTADNQSTVARALQDAGAALVVTPDALIDTLARHVAFPQQLANMVNRAAVICDGLGARRVVAALEPSFAQDGQPVVLRPATMDDAQLMLEWQRQPSVRAFARNPRVPETEEHYAWLTNRLNDPSCMLLIIEYGMEPCGVLRLDSPNAAGRHEISIYVDPARHRLGIGTAALAQLRRLVPAAALEAAVLVGNEASANLFSAAGYRLLAEGVYVNTPDREGA